MTDKKPVHNEEFSWTVHDFSRPKKAVEEVKMEWPKEPERPRRSVDLDEPISFDIDVFKKRSEGEQLPKEEAMFVTKTEDVSVETTPEETTSAVFTPEAAKVEEAAPGKEPEKKPVEAREGTSPEQKIQELAELTEKLRKQQNAERQAAAQNAMNSSRQAAAMEAREESLRKADPFFDFSNTNIAFQDLLDQEYAKLQKRKEGVPYVESQWRYQPDAEEEPAPVEEVPVTVEEASAPELPESPEDALERMIMEGTRTIDPENDATIQVDLGAIKKAAAQRYGYENAADLDGVPVELTEGEPKVETPEEEPIPVVKAVEDIVSPEEPETPEQTVKKRNTMTEMERAREEYFRMLDQEMNGVQVKVEVNTPYGQAGKVVTDVDIKPGQPVERHTTVLKPEDIREAAAGDPVGAEADAVTGTGAVDPKMEETPKQPEPEEEIVWPLDPSQYEEEERGGFFSVLGKILLVVIAIVIALELAALAILYFAPDSSMADTVGGVQSKVMDFIGSIGSGDEGEEDPITDDQPQNDGQNDPVDGQDPNGGEAGGTDPVIDTAPMADKAALIRTQMDRNENIKSITANETLKYKSGVDYGIADLNQSKPIENNLWYTDEAGNPVYYDQEVVGALIAFNSQWVDYVNEGDTSALSLTKEGSDAYENAAGFSKAGKVKEEFTGLEIGEIRQGQQGFYLWAGEEIKLTENGETSTASYQWVYCMEPVGQEMKITDYISVRNK